jgi:hypothetical protein
MSCHHHFSRLFLYKQSWFMCLPALRYACVKHSYLFRCKNYGGSPSFEAGWSGCYLKDPAFWANNFGANVGPGLCTTPIKVAIADAFRYWGFENDTCSSAAWCPLPGWNIVDNIAGGVDGVLG